MLNELQLIVSIEMCTYDKCEKLGETIYDWLSLGVTSDIPNLNLLLFRSP